MPAKQLALQSLLLILRMIQMLSLLEEWKVV